jgi:plastocyanin
VRFPRLILAPLALLALISVVTACGGGDGQLSAEEYFQQMDEIDKDLDRRGSEVLGESGISAREGADRLVAAADGAKQRYREMEPPDDLKDAHDVVIEAMDEFGDEMDNAADDAPEGALLTDLFRDPPLVTADEDLSEAFCALQKEADERGIDADVGCDLADGEQPPDPARLPAEETADVRIENFAFDPPHIQVAAGDTVTWTQGGDGTPHTATATEGTFDSGEIGDPGDTFQFTFEDPGEYSYSCSIHPEMRGQVTVTE